MKSEINNIIRFPSGRYLPCGLNIYQKIWWKFVPGKVIKVKWPRGNLVIDHNHPKWQDMGGAVWVDLGFSADPNDHYRPWLEKNVGKQGWDWNWGFADSDATDDTLTIKIRRGREKYATLLGLMWS